ncbi:interferon-inducible double-stranded RNA-dependent protein kinase activator A-like [Chelonus insularis]|uniref:interferon-inducible double-stranded RNA-dependent protein kinase activator A-like n=1 Tax=Chelonus insularis TaxID=460826 RepID=UPI00158D466E|nr:interferon-inducible double-stranded RNA-dependent protein kinase activator A-like [Chelonus insularis]
MQKTPVSILQELMVKKKCVPNYELIHDGGGTHENTFTYQVTCSGLTSSGAILSATGTGRCKKDAKHLAAKNMLAEIAKKNAFLPLPASPAESPVRTPIPKPQPEPLIHPPNEPFINAIGELKDLCAEHELPEPEYITVSDIGPPHARIFTIHCILSSFTEEGIGTTKKHAKHLAARKMYERLKEIITESKSTFSIVSEVEDKYNSLKISAPPEDIDQVNKSIDMNSVLGKLTSYPRKDLGVKVSDYWRNISDSYSVELREEVAQNLMQFKADLTSWEIDDVDQLEENALQRFREILEMLNLSIKKLVFNVDGKTMIALYVNTVPEIVEVAVDENKTELIRRAFSQLACNLRFLLL